MKNSDTKSNQQNTHTKKSFIHYWDEVGMTQNLNNILLQLLLIKTNTDETKSFGLYSVIDREVLSTFTYACMYVCIRAYRF